MPTRAPRDTLALSLSKIPSLSDDPTHPAQITLRTYALALSLSLGPSLVPFVLALLRRRKITERTDAKALRRVLRRELSLSGFAFSVTVAVGGGAALRRLWKVWDEWDPEAFESQYSDALESFGSLNSEAAHEGYETVDPSNSDARPNDVQLLSKLLSTLSNLLTSLFARLHSLSASLNTSLHTLHTSLHTLTAYINTSLNLNINLTLTSAQKTFIANLVSSSIGIILLQSGRRRGKHLRTKSYISNSSSNSSSTPSVRADDAPSPTLDLTLLLLVRAVDVFVQSFVFKRSGSTEDPASSATMTSTSKSYSSSTSRILGTSKPAQPYNASLQPPDVDAVRRALEDTSLGKDCRKAKGKDSIVLHEKVSEKERRARKGKVLSKKGENLRTTIDAVVFWASSARIMWCFFYEPERLPRSYLKWISALASVDPRLLNTIQHIRKGTWAYTTGASVPAADLTAYAQDLGHPSTWGDPAILPAYGGAAATVVWRTLGVPGRHAAGGIPCELVHGETGRVGKWGKTLGLEKVFGNAGSCEANMVLRGARAFFEAVAIYLPAHFFPVLLTRPSTLLRPERFLTTLLGAFRSAAFLSTFISTMWYTICLVRTRVVARLLPLTSVLPARLDASRIPHDFIDGPYGCILAGCLMCGSSIWIEDGRRRGEMALYVLPKAVRACLPDGWVRGRGKGSLERLTFVLSISSLLTAAIHSPDSLRGLSRWTLAFVMNGPNAGFWKRKRVQESLPASLAPSGFQTPGGAETRSETPLPAALLTEELGVSEELVVPLIVEGLEAAAA